MARKTKFDQLREQAVRRAEEWGKSVTTSPAPLHELAKSLEIQSIRFEPLLSSAGLEKNTRGFSIIVNTEGFGATSPAGTVLQPSEEEWGELRPPVRFSVAHEMAHVIFMKLARAERSDLLRKKLEELEVACNRIAGMILIPAQYFLRHVSKDLFDASRLRTLLTEIRVSPEVFVRRLKQPDMQRAFRDLHGYLAFVRQDNAKLRIVASEAFGPHARARFGERSVQGTLGRSQTRNTQSKSLWDKQWLTLDDLDLPSDDRIRLSNDEVHRQEIAVRCKNNVMLPCVFSAARCTNNPVGFLIAVEVTDGPKPRHADATF